MYDRAGSLIGDGRRAISRISDFRLARRDPVRFARRLGVRVGSGCLLIAPTAATFGGEPFLVWLGNNVVISTEVRMVTHDGGIWVGRALDPSFDVFGPVIVRSGAFVGIRAILLPGAVVGEGAVIAAGAVVAGDVPPGVVAGGVPARPICSVEDYLARASRKNARTSGMSPVEKRRVAMDRFRDIFEQEEYRERQRSSHRH